jgi:hypothetical protein
MKRLQLIIDLDEDTVGDRQALEVATEITRLTFGFVDGDIYGARLAGARWLTTTTLPSRSTP